MTTGAPFGFMQVLRMKMWRSESVWEEHTHVDRESSVGSRTQVGVPERVREGYFALVL